MATKIIDTYTGDVLGTIYTNHGVTMDEAVDMISATIDNTAEPWDPNVITADGREYYYDGLAFSDTAD